MNSENNFDIIVIGAGAIGMFVTYKFQNAGFNTLLIEASNKVGGQLKLYLEKEIHNIPLIDTIKAKDLIENLYSRIDKTRLKLDEKVIDIQQENNKTDEIFFKIITNNNTYTTKYVILACGNGEIIPMKLPVNNTMQFENKTLFYEIQNEKLFQDKNIVIAGGGDSVIDWTIELTKIAKSITIIHRREINKPENPEFLHFQELVKNNQITTKIPYQITKINEDNNINEIRTIEITNNETKQVEELETDYLLVFFGLQSGKSEILQKMNTKISHINAMSEMENLFCIGDCCKYDGKVKIIPMGFSEALKCFHYICQKEKSGINIYGKNTERK